MSEKLEILEQQLKHLENEKSSKIQERNNLVENNPEVKRYIRLGYVEKKLEIEISDLKMKIEEQIMLDCHHSFINTNSKGGKYCIKCGLSTEFKDDVQERLNHRKIYEQTMDNSEIINVDYICKTEVIKRIYNTILYQYPYISKDKLVHFVAVAIHNMQTKKKSDNVKRNRAKRLYLRPSFLEKSNML